MADHRHRRPADEGTPALGARQRQGLLRRRRRRDGRCGNPGASQGCRRVDQCRLRSAAGSRQSGGRTQERRATDSRGRARQQVLPLGNRRQGRNRRGIRQGGARHQARHRQQPTDSECDRAARCGSLLQPRRRWLHALRHESESARRTAVDDRIRARLTRNESARHRAGCRGRLRLEDLPVSGRDGDGLGIQARQSPDQVDGGA